MLLFSFPLTLTEKKSANAVESRDVLQAVKKGGELFKAGATRLDFPPSSSRWQSREAAMDSHFLTIGASLTAELAHKVSAGARSYPVGEYANKLRKMINQQGPPSHASRPLSFLISLAAGWIAVARVHGMQAFLAGR